MDIFTKGNLYPVFRYLRRRRRTLPALPSAQLPSAQNNPHVNVAYFGFDPLHLSSILSLQLEGVIFIIIAELYAYLYAIARLVKNPGMQKTPVQFLGREDLLEKG